MLPKILCREMCLLSHLSALESVKNTVLNMATPHRFIFQVSDHAAGTTGPTECEELL